MKKLRCVIFAVLLSAFLVSPAIGADFEFEGTIEAKDPASHLLAYYVNRFTPEEFFLSVDEPPDASGRVRDVFMDLTGIKVDGVRIDKLVIRMNDVQFNLPSEWEQGNVECLDALRVYAYCLLKEDDLNRHLASKTFGDDDHWSKIAMDISPNGFYAQGTYTADVLFVTLDILIEVESGLKIVENKTIWLDNYKVRVNRLDVPDFITRRAVEQIQPLLDLGRLPIPLKLHSIKLEEGQAAFSTRVLPTPPEKGITYRYLAEPEAGTGGDLVLTTQVPDMSGTPAASYR